MNMYGHNGRYLKVNLSTDVIVEERYDHTFARMYLGGNGFAVKLIFDNISPDVDPLSPENGIVFAVGPLTDTPVWGTSRGQVASISPLTGLFADSNFGGDFPVVQKRTGYDAIIVTGKAEKPAYLFVSEKGAELRDASSMWGKTTEESIAMLQKEAGKESITASIGPAGENGVIFANVIFGGKRPGAAGRGGMGAVMGSKNLKAIVVKGSRKTEVAKPEELNNFLQEKLPELKKNKGGMTNFGTAALPGMVNSKGLFGTRNNTRETFENWEDISGDFFIDKYKGKRTACHGCVIACGKTIEVGEGNFSGKIVKMPEYETLYAMGSMLDNNDINSIFNGNHLCDLMGLDTITMGVTLAFVAECMENGIVSEEELGGNVSFSDGRSMIDLLGKTVAKEGIGEYLAMGSWQLSKRFGKDSHKYLHAVKGMEIAGHSPRGMREMSLGYSISTRGGSHHDTRPFYPATHPDRGFDEIPEYVVKSNYFTSVGDSLAVCRFIAEGMLEPPSISSSMATMVNLITGWDVDVSELEQMGERVYNLERLINVRRGVSRKDDILPYRVMNEPIPDGPSKGRYCPKNDLDTMLDRYYELRGWTKDGIPSDAKLEELKLI
jgi:aldehyde:ferredoxin oxidoreductase